MTSSSCATEIRNLIDSLVRAEIVIDSNAVGIISGGRRARVTWLGASSGTLFVPGASPSLADYRRWLRERQFTVVLEDGALLQISFDFEREDMVGHRLAYVPCPVDLEPGLLLQVPLLDLLENLGPIPVDDVKLRGPLRFDFDPGPASPEHAASHLTMITNECRVPAIGPLSLGHFVRFVFRRFYPHMWNVHPFLRNWSQISSRRTITADEEPALHFNWRS
jgi:hypothetical protein